MRIATVIMAIMCLQNVKAAQELSPCDDDTDCEAVNPYDLCVLPKGKTQKVCVHKPLFPLHPKEWVGTVVFSLFMLLANVAGIGGGGVAIPLAMVFFNLSFKPAVAISSFSIMCATLARFFYNWNERHPEKPTMVSIDYGLTIIMQPLNLMGSVIGVLFYTSFPALALMIMLTLLLLVMFIDSWFKYKKMRLKEDEQEAKAKAEKEQAELEAKEKSGEQQDEEKRKKNQQEIEMTSLEKKTEVEQDASSNGGKGTKREEDDIVSDNSSQSKIKQITQSIVNDKIRETQLQKDTVQAKDKDKWGLPLSVDDPDKNQRLQNLRNLVQQELSHGIWKKQGINFGLLLILLIVSFLRGSPGFEKCSVGDNILYGLFIIAMICFVCISAKLVAKEQILKREFGNINVVSSDLIFEGIVMKKVLFLGFSAGWVAGALGLGGGVIFNPLLIGLGVPPRVSSATGMYMITFSKISTCILYFINGQLMYDYGLWIAAWSTVGAIIGLKGANIYMAKFNRQSIIVFFLTLVLGLSVIGVPVFGAIDLQKRSDAGEDITSFNDLCKQ